MKAATVKQLKDELKHQERKQLEELILRLGKFKAENKELLTYLLFESHDENAFVQSAKVELDADFANLNTSSSFYVKKSLRKMIRKIRKYSRYSLHKETEVELFLYFARQIKSHPTRLLQSNSLLKIYLQQMATIKNKIAKLHEDLQYDYQMEVQELQEMDDDYGYYI